MDSFAALAMGMANRGKPLMVFDWNKAAELIKSRQPVTVSAGLAGDWEYTGGEIWANGKPVPEDEAYVYLASTWAYPEIEIDGVRQVCYVMEDETDGWDAHTYWPDEALGSLSVAT